MQTEVPLSRLLVVRAPCEGWGKLHGHVPKVAGEANSVATLLEPEELGQLGLKGRGH